MDFEDIHLIRKARRGDYEAFSCIVKNYQNYVYSTIYGILQNRVDAEDVTQETFIKAFQSLKKLQDERAFSTWLIRIAIRTAIDCLKAKQKWPSVELDSEKISTPHDPHPAIDTRMDIERALRELSEEHRIVTILRAVHELEYDEISVLLDIPIGTVRSRVHYARSRLREILKEERGTL
ncbi:RNA polymerase sigma factor [Alicyclobacillus tolerans]|uniref:RNA polymerase sigma factor n=2 Tax=Alicyclobacillus tolerans TaxID=90970 RepID=A0ABT9LYS4_9BACL|nr:MULTISPECIES: sigma-70 family RNA polymerase sigma factor [Alicyclobacillus]MDP9729412.1 RNA polymerase sigma-70 factor (ECF subfamily) [Alicyclobacillus tengchongensis]QRF22781.1 sigma-70 family RNA polymerase sigma factor [Alicyclobacillus sp. TC]SHK21775.1 RNA polymerase sigma-70 factor, ECF subfamily [Alicyclobacillus montanus]